MIENVDFPELFEDFPELAEIGVILQKEVLAHFGLLFSSFANLEAGLQMCYVMQGMKRELDQKMISSMSDWHSRYDHYERRAFAATFGTLLKLTNEISELSTANERLKTLKKSRDYFAHHFFREENSKLHSSEATLFLMDKMRNLRMSVDEVAKEVDEIYRHVSGQIIEPQWFDKRAKELMESHMKEAIDHPRFEVGWAHPDN